VFAALLSLSRRLTEFSRYQRHNRWAQHLIDPNTLGLLRGQTLLVLGLGGIGSEVARLAHAFGMRVNAVALRPGSAPPFVEQIGSTAQLDTLLATADVVVNALPLTSETRGVFDAQRFRTMKRGAVFINVARGASVVTDALTVALQTGHLAGAALDVTDPEPLPRHHRLWRMSNVLITPHVAGLSRASKHWPWLVMRENLRRYVHGEPMLCVVRVNAQY
jgi:phosphoglycerate dehydrogenase-like enzyme